MQTYTVNQLASLAGVSVRTLHHYDEIGLLEPAFTGENRYRHYGEKELLRLQQILIHRAMGIPLAEIGALLNATGFDQLETLERQRERLVAEARRFAEMVGTVDRTIARLKGELQMQDDELYSGLVAPEKQAEYEAWLVARFGEGVRPEIARGARDWDGMSEAQRLSVMDEVREIEDALAEGLRRGVPPQARELDTAIAAHRAWVSRSWKRDCTPEAYAGLAEVYQHPDFRQRYEAIAPGFADYLTTAMRAWAQRQA